MKRRVSNRPVGTHGTTHTTCSHLKTCFISDLIIYPFLTHTHTHTHLFSCSACMLMFHLGFFFNFLLDQCEYCSLQSKCQPSCLYTHTHIHPQHTWCPVLLVGSHCPRTPYLHRQASRSRLTMEPFWKQTPSPPPLQAHRKGKHRGSCSALKQPWQNILTGWYLLVLPGTRPSGCEGTFLSLLCLWLDSAILGQNCLLLQGSNDDDDVPKCLLQLLPPHSALLTAQTWWSIPHRLPRDD